MKTVKSKLSRHFSGVFQAVAVMWVICVVVWGTLTAFEDIYERYSPVDAWYMYGVPALMIENDVMPHGKIVIHSNWQWFQTMEFSWADALYCELDTGIEVRIGVQKWSEYLGKDERTPDGTWTWDSGDIPDDAVRCRIRGDVVGLTPRGYKKHLSYVTGWLPVVKQIHL